MHEHMCLAMGQCDSAGKVSKKMKKHALSDWETDCKGHEGLTANQFMDCWFQLTDQHTDKICLEEYTVFLYGMMEKMTIIDDETKIRRWRTFEEILDAEQRARSAALLLQGKLDKFGLRTIVVCN